MSKNIHIEKIQELLRLVKDRLVSIGKLNKEVPKLEQAREELEWMLESENSAPKITFNYPSEDVLGNLSRLENYLSAYAIPDPPSSGTAVISSTTTSSSTDYVSHVSNLGSILVDYHEVTTWQSTVIEDYSRLRDRQKRSGKTKMRLEQLDSSLRTLHDKSIVSYLSVSANIGSPIEAAGLLRELLVRFKGELIRHCKTGKGTKYERIASNLAADSQTTHDVICEQQSTYDRLHSDLSEIAKSRKSVRGSELKGYLQELEDHILITTSAIDEDKIGFEFYG